MGWGEASPGSGAFTQAVQGLCPRWGPGFGPALSPRHSQGVLEKELPVLRVGRGQP